MEYKCQRLYRDARIFSIYEGTTQLQVVAAIRYVMNGTYLGIVNDMLAEENISEEFLPLKEKVQAMIALYDEAVTKVKDAADQELQDFLARRLYDMIAEIMMSILILADATKAPELFAKSANVYVRMAEENVIGKSSYVRNFVAENLSSFRAVEE